MGKRKLATVKDDLEAREAYSRGETKKKWHLKDLQDIQPKGDNQLRAFDEFFKGQHLFLSGHPGVGKSFLAIYLGLNAVLDPDSPEEQMIILRSAVPTRDVGFLQGSLEEKLEAYEAPYHGIFDDLFEYSKNYENLKKSKKVEFMSTSYIRGLTFDNKIVVVDESENLNFHELDSVITRCGVNTRFIFCGDSKQSDHKKESDIKAHDKFIDIVKTLDQFTVIDFTVDDIVRSGLVRDYIIAREEMTC